MDADMVRLVGIIGQLIVGLAILLVVWLLGRDTAVPRPVAVRGWFIVAVAGLAVVVLAAVRLASVLA